MGGPPAATFFLTEGKSLMYICLRGHVMKRVNLFIDDDIYETLKRIASQRQESVADIVRKTLRDWIDRFAGGDTPTLRQAQVQNRLRVLDAHGEAASAKKKKRISPPPRAWRG